MLQRFVMAVGLFMAGTAALNAALVSEDFSYVSTTLLNQNGGSGAWSGAWGPSTGTGANTTRIRVDTTANLSYGGGGYSIAQSGTGRAYGDFNGFRGINRYIDTNLSGTVWFSILARNLASTDFAGIQFNNHADAPFTGIDYNRGNFDVQLSGTSLNVRYGGVDSSSLTSLPTNTTHLLLGRITFQDNGINDRFDLWANPADLLNLGVPLFSSNTADFGEDLYLAGIFAYGASNVSGANQGYLDALRISDGGGSATVAFAEVTGVIPEPSLLVSLGVAGICCICMFRIRQ